MDNSQYDYIVQSGDGYVEIARSVLAQSERVYLSSIAELSKSQYQGKTAKDLPDDLAKYWKKSENPLTYVQAYRIVEEYAEAIESDLGYLELQTNARIIVKHIEKFLPRFLKNKITTKSNEKQSRSDERKESSEKKTKSEQVVEVKKKKIIVIDPGHGGIWAKVLKDHGDPGKTVKVGKKEIREAVEVLKVANEVKKLLEEKGYKVYLTRERDELPLPSKYKPTTRDDKRNKSLDYRGEFATSKKANVFVSIHFNSSTNKDASGAQILYRYTGDKTKKLREKIIDGLKNNNIKLKTSQLYVKDKYRVLGFASSIPGIIVEGAYMTNSSDINNIINSVFQKKLAKGIVEGVEKYFK